MENWKSKIFPNVKNAKLNLFTGISTYGKFGEKHSVKTEKVLNMAKSFKNFGVNLYKPLKREDLFKNLINQEFFCTKEQMMRLFVWQSKPKHKR